MSSVAVPTNLVRGLAGPPHLGVLHVLRLRVPVAERGEERFRFVDVDLTALPVWCGCGAGVVDEGEGRVENTIFWGFKTEHSSRGRFKWAR